MRHVNDLVDFSKEELLHILELARTIKANPSNYAQLLQGQSLALLFQKTSTRTRVSFEVAMTQFGGHALFIDWRASNFVLTELEYEIEYLSRNVEGIMARLLSQDDIARMMTVSQVPVINGCCDRYHPCQGLTDVLTMTEHSDKPLDALHLLYTGVQNNVSNSLATLADRLGFTLTLATPRVTDSDDTTRSLQQRIQASDHVRWIEDPNEAIATADFVYTDTWINMEHFNAEGQASEQEALVEEMLPFQLNESLVGDLDVRIMHDMPIHNNFEITPGLVRDPRSIIFDQAANRLHAQKALLALLLAAI
ncbi:MAG: ornithine carbamoyltransferase [Pseudomonadales bacterium]